MHKSGDVTILLFNSFSCNEQCTYQNSLDVKFTNNYEYKNSEKRRVSPSEIEMKSFMLRT